MSNCENFLLPILEVEAHQAREVLRAVLHTIVFNRALGCVQPIEIDSELFDISYVQCGDHQVAQTIEEKITTCCSWLERNPGKLMQANLSFYEKRRKQAWFGRQGERLYWEQWCIPLAQINSPDCPEPLATNLHADNSTAARKEHLVSALEDVLTLIVSTVNTKRDHIPPVVTQEIVTFPFEISIEGSESSFDTVKRMLLQTTPPAMLGN
mmetsp:Transcript_37560/g.67282  ORF Transcript_37560/g.67282 Transcript_37560/m.67282 type:complete len:210 (-) Transcript_37560:324-953(-)